MNYEFVFKTRRIVQIGNNVIAYAMNRDPLLVKKYSKWYIFSSYQERQSVEPTKLESLDRHLFGFAVTPVNDSSVVLSGGTNKRVKVGGTYRASSEVFAHQVKAGKWV